MTMKENQSLGEHMGLERNIYYFSPKFLFPNKRFQDTCYNTPTINTEHSLGVFNVIPRTNHFPDFRTGF